MSLTAEKVGKHKSPTSFTSWDTEIQRSYVTAVALGRVSVRKPEPDPGSVAFGSYVLFLLLFFKVFPFMVPINPKHPYESGKFIKYSPFLSISKGHTIMRHDASTQ